MKPDRFSDSYITGEGVATPGSLFYLFVLSNLSRKGGRRSFNQKTETMPLTIDATQFGVTGDGITDDTTAFNNAVVYAASNNLTLLVGPGTYMLDSITLPSGAHIAGSGKNSILKLRPGSSDNRQLFLINGNSNNIRLTALNIDANRAQNTGINIVCLKAIDSGSGDPISDINITGCTFSNSRDRALLWFCGFSINNVIIKECTFTDAGAQAIETRGCSNFYFHNNLITAWGQLNGSTPGFGLQSVINDNIHITENLFKNTVAGQFAVESAGAYVQHTVISNNVFDGNHLPANGCSGYFRETLFAGNRHINGMGSHRSGYEIIGNKIQIMNNYLENGAVVFTCDDINPVTELRPNGDTCIITGNIINTNAMNQSSLYISGFNSAENIFAVAKNVIVSDNSIDNRGSSGNAATISLGFYGTNGYISNVTLVNNKVFADAGQPCIRMRSAGISDQVKILNNQFLSGLKGIMIDNTSSWQKVEFSGNDFTNIPYGSEYTFGAGSFTEEFKVFNNTSSDSFSSIKIDESHFLLAGPGNPEGSTTAQPGSLFLSTDGGSAATLFVKETGNGNTGWVAVSGLGPDVSLLDIAQTYTAQRTFNKTILVNDSAGGIITNASRGPALVAAALTSHSKDAGTENIFLSATRPGTPGSSGFKASVGTDNQVYFTSGNTDMNFFIAGNQVMKIFNTRAIQIKDGATNSMFTDDSSVIFSAHSTTKGVLLPRMTASQRAAIATPATGLLIFQTDNTPGLCIYNGSNWEKVNTTVIP